MDQRRGVAEGVEQGAVPQRSARRQREAAEPQRDARVNQRGDVRAVEGRVCERQVGQAGFAAVASLIDTQRLQ